MKITTWILFVAATMLAVPAFSQARFEYDTPIDANSGAYELDQSLDNPCTAVYDRIWVDYDVYVEQAYADSNDRFIFDEMTSMGGTYRAAGSTQSDVTYTAPFTLRKYHKVNTSDDFHVVTVITFYPSTRDTYVSVETACGNGMPDSKE